MSDLNCNSCNELRQNAAEFVTNGVTEAVCNSLKNDTGFNAALSVQHTNCEDLHDANDCLIGMMAKEVEAYEACDWKVYAKKFVGNIYEVLKAMICSMCGIWSKFWQLIRALGGSNNTLPVFKKYTYTVPAEKFVDESGDLTGCKIWFSGSPAMDECYISIPVSEMDTVVGVWAQPKVVGGKPSPVTCAVQSYVKQGNNLIVNFDAFEIIALPQYINAPYALTIDFLVVGTRKMI